jgi:hypothetical protein
MPFSANTSDSLMNPALMFSGPAMTRGQASESTTWPIMNEGSERIIGENRTSILRFCPKTSSP